MWFLDVGDSGGRGHLGLSVWEFQSYEALGSLRISILGSGALGRFEIPELEDPDFRDVVVWGDWHSGVWDLEVPGSWGPGVSDSLGVLGKSEVLKEFEGAGSGRKRGRSQKLNMAQYHHLLYLPPHYSQ